MTDIKLNIKIVGNPRGVAVLQTNRELSRISAFDGGGTAMHAQNGLFPTRPNDGKKCFVVGVTALGDTEYKLTAERGYTGYITRDLVAANGDLPTAGGSASGKLKVWKKTIDWTQGSPKFYNRVAVQFRIRKIG